MASSSNILGGKRARGTYQQQSLRRQVSINQIHEQAEMTVTSANDPKYLEAALQYPQDVFITGEALRLTPAILAPLVTTILTSNGRALKALIGYLFPLVEERLAKRAFWEANPHCRPLDCVQWIIDSSPRKDPWTAEKIVQETLALWFGSVHQMAMTFVYALYDLCNHPEYIAPLRAEMDFVGTDWWMKLDQMTLLDSFMKESARMNPSDSISIRRKALAPYTFADGTHVPKGNWACVPQRAIQRDACYYSSPEIFNGFRFAQGKEGIDCPKRGPFTDLDTKYPFWGLGKRACPGRFYAAAIMKLMVAHVLLHYDIKFQDEKAELSFSWRSAIIPRSGTKLLFRERVPGRSSCNSC
ncbi:MAG: hypothetical protein M1830_009824 [Pleopsidium flavum]|nr:MAG: hypothetical protein M1830_009824 [Pleopsidium flavum]